MADEKNTEVLFYHLERTTLERVLPSLLEKSLEKGWRAVVQASSAERVAALDTALWCYRDESFLPHGGATDEHAGLFPVVLTDDDANPNDAQIRFFVDGAEAGDLTGYKRAVYLFDGRDEGAVSRARAQWKTAQAAGHDVTYWQQNQSGKWERKA
ncbi:MAG: DNA polymerase III subunit chi [Methyloligellaceae bacterium]